MLKQIAKDSATVVVVLVCTVAAFAVLFIVVYRLMLLAGCSSSRGDGPIREAEDEAAARLPSAATDRPRGSGRSSDDGLGSSRLSGVSPA